MIKKLLLETIILFWFSSLSFSQNMVEQLRLKDDINILNNRVIKLLKKEPLLAKIKEPQIYHIFFLGYEGEFTKENFLNKSFLNELVPCSYTLGYLCKKRYLQTETFITDSSRNLVAIGDARYVSSFCNYDSNYLKDKKALLRNLFTKEIDFVFYLLPTPMSAYFGIKGEDVYVFKSTSTGLKTYSLEEFINCCWDKFIPPPYFLKKNKISSLAPDERSL